MDADKPHQSCVFVNKRRNLMSAINILTELCIRRTEGLRTNSTSSNSADKFEKGRNWEMKTFFFCLTLFLILPFPLKAFRLQARKRMTFYCNFFLFMRTKLTKICFTSINFPFTPQTISTVLWRQMFAWNPVVLSSGFKKLYYQFRKVLEASIQSIWRMITIWLRQ